MTDRSLPTALRWAARWRTAARIARRDATRHRRRTALVALLIALPLVAGSAGLVLLRSTEPSDASILRDTLGTSAQARITVECDGAPFLPSPEGGGWCGDDDPDAATAVDVEDAVSDALPPGAGRIPVRPVLVDHIAGAASQVSKSLAALDLGDDRIASLTALDEGRLPRDTSEILLSGHMARSALVGIGDRVDLRPAQHGAIPDTPTTTYTVVGTSRVGAGLPVDFVTLPGTPLAPADSTTPASAWYVTGDAPVLAEHAEALRRLGLEVVSRDVVVRPRSTLAASRPLERFDLGFVDSSTATVGAVVGLMLVLEAILLICPAFVVGARRETRNLALVAAVGGEPADLRRVVLSTGLVIGGGGALAGTIVGTALGAALVPALRTKDVYVPDVAIPVVELCALTLAGTLVALASAWWPARGAARTDVVAALTGRRPTPPVRRRPPVLGLVALGVGLLAATVGALTGQTLVLALGVLVLELGTIGTVGSLMGGLARTARRAGPSLRYALRDADRHRARTVPALAAIIAATAVTGAALTYQHSQEAHELRIQGASAAAGTVIVTVSEEVSDPGTSPDDTPPRWDAVVASTADALERTFGEVPIVEVRTAVPPSSSPRSAQVATMGVARPADKACSPEQQASDLRCGDGSWSWSPFARPGTASPVIVDDGTVVRALSLPGSAEIARSLDAGSVVVASERDLWDTEDGSTVAHVIVPGRDSPVVVPAVAHPWGERGYPLIVPPGLVDDTGWSEEPMGLVVPASAGVDDTQVTAARRLQDPSGADVAIHVETTYTTPASSHAPAIGAAALLGALATWIVVGLAASESRPDLATIAAVGASPRTRRRLAGAQAGVLAGVGTITGTVTGVVVGGVLVLGERVRAGWMGWAWQLDLPWALLALLACAAPILAVAGAALTTRSELPVARRLAS